MMPLGGARSSCSKAAKQYVLFVVSSTCGAWGGRGWGLQPDRCASKHARQESPLTVNNVIPATSQQNQSALKATLPALPLRPAHSPSTHSPACLEHEHVDRLDQRGSFLKSQQAAVIQQAEEQQGDGVP